MFPDKVSTVLVMSVGVLHTNCITTLCETSPPHLEFQVIYDRLGVTIIERGESFYQPIMPDVVKDLEDKGKPLVFLTIHVCAYVYIHVEHACIVFTKKCLLNQIEIYCR